jgi:hypothetical protein
MKLTCTCSHAFQDRVYGPQKRVHNMTKETPKGIPQPYRCTVCGNVKTKAGR